DVCSSDWASRRLLWSWRRRTAVNPGGISRACWPCSTATAASAARRVLGGQCPPIDNCARHLSIESNGKQSKLPAPVPFQEENPMTLSGSAAQSPRPGLRFTLVLLSIFFSIFWFALTGRNAAADPPLWTDVDEADIALRGERRIVPDSYRTLSLNVDALHAILATAPMEFSEAAKSDVAEIFLPLPDGSMARIGFVE